MRPLKFIPGLLMIAGLIALTGCHEYRVEVDVAADGSGARTETLESDKVLSPETRRLLAIDGDAWRVTAGSGADGNEVEQYQRRQTVADLEDWATMSGTFLRGTADGTVRLVSDVTLEQVRGAGRVRHVYRETLAWTKLNETVADLVGGDYATFLRREFPDLPDSLVHEARGAMTATIIMNWTELAEADSGDDREAELGERFNLMIVQRLLRAGVDPDLAQRVVRATANWGYFDGLQDAVPGLELCGQASLTLVVTMPAPITGGNADTIDGSRASFQVDLARTIAGPVTLEVISER